MKDFYTRHMVISLFMLIFLLANTIPGMAEMPNHLTPCYNSLMGRGILNEYFKELHKVFFREHDIASYDCLLRMMTVPSFSLEEMVMVYKTFGGEVLVKYVVADGSIWNVVHHHYSFNSASAWGVFFSELARQKSIRKALNRTDEFIARRPKPVSLKAYQAPISFQTAAVLHKIWWGMVHKTRFSPTGASCLDGVSYLFSAGTGICGVAHCPSEHSLPRRLVEIGEQLEVVATYGTASEDYENTLYELATQLLDELREQDPEIDKRFLMHFGEGFCQ